jgi:hypothetical protein
MNGNRGKLVNESCKVQPDNSFEKVVGAFLGAQKTPRETYQSTGQQKSAFLIFNVVEIIDGIFSW